MRLRQLIYLLYELGDALWWRVHRSAWRRWVTRQQ